MSMTLRSPCGLAIATLCRATESEIPQSTQKFFVSFFQKRNTFFLPSCHQTGDGLQTNALLPNFDRRHSVCVGKPVPGRSAIGHAKRKFIFPGIYDFGAVAMRLQGKIRCVIVSGKPCVV